jgi:uncharacterized protein YcbX
MLSAQVSGLFIYPIKSAGGIPVEQSTLTEFGLLNDRRWMVVTGKGQFVTQRNRPELALIGAGLEADGVVLTREGHGSFRIPFECAGGTEGRARVWKDEVRVIDEGDAAAHWLTNALGMREYVRIVRMAPGFRRRLSQPERFGPGTTTHFADSAPYLVASESSLEALNRELESEGRTPVPMNRFRPNIVLRGLPPFAEHRTAALDGEGWRLKLVDHCERCIVTTIDQETAERDPGREPFQTLRRINPAPGPKGAPAFAQNATLDRGPESTIFRGADVSIREITDR